MANRSDIRTSVRYYLYEDTADLFSDNQINQAISDTLRELPKKGVYLEDTYTTTTIINQLSYTLPTNTFKVEKLEINNGTATQPDWDPMAGWDQYNNALYLRTLPYTADTIRVHIRKKFTDLTGDSTTTDVPSDILEVLYSGIVYRCYTMLIGYLVDAKNWDSIAKPDGISLNQVANWTGMAKKRYDELINTHKRFPRPRDINLVE